MRCGTLSYVTLKRTIIKLIHILFKIFLQDFIIDPWHFLDPSDDVNNIFRGLLELRDAPVKDMVTPEPARQPPGRHQGEEAQDAPDGPRLPVFCTFCVAASGTKVDEEDH